MLSLFMYPLLVLGYLSLAHAAIVPGRAFDRFITIWLENQDFAKVIADPDFVDLKRYGILHTRFYAATHPSQPNYVAAVGGDYFGLNHDEVVRIPSNVSTLVDLLDTRDISWAGYFEGNPGPGYMASGSVNISKGTAEGNWDYVRKHNHFVSYDSINMNGTRLARLLSFEDFKRDLAAGTVPQFVAMSPDMLNDGHNTTLDYATKWAREFLLPLLSDSAFAERTVIQLTYDEADDYKKPNQIVSLLLGNGVPKNKEGSEDDTFYSHYSTLSTLQNNWELPNLGRFDVGANVYKLVADVTGYRNKDPKDVANVNNSISYKGFLNNQSTMHVPLSAPNIKLIGAGGLPILDAIRYMWQSHSSEKTPYDGTGNGQLFDGDKHYPIYYPQGGDDA